jgi:hypothetical protein
MRSVVALALLGMLSVAAAALPARTAVPHANYTIYMYKAKVAVKGGTTLSNTYTSDIGAVGDVKQENAGGSFHVDGTITNILVYVGKVPKRFPLTTTAGASAVVNGTWSDQGRKWSDPSNGVTVPFTCGGKIAAVTPQGAVGVEATRGASSFKIRLAVETVELTDNPPGVCPNKSEAQTLRRVDSDVYVTELLIPKSQMGEKTFVRQISGPLAKYRSELGGACSDNPSSCSFNMTWQGNVRFTRTRTIRIKY